MMHRHKIHNRPVHVRGVYRVTRRAPANSVVRRRSSQSNTTQMALAAGRSVTALLATTSVARRTWSSVTRNSQGRLSGGSFTWQFTPRWILVG